MTHQTLFDKDGFRITDETPADQFRHIGWVSQYALYKAVDNHGPYYSFYSDGGGYRSFESLLRLKGLTHKDVNLMAGEVL